MNRKVELVELDDFYNNSIKEDNDKSYAEKGLKIKIPTKYKKNVPFRLTHCSLAKFLGRVDIVNSEEKEIKKNQ